MNRYIQAILLIIMAFLSQLSQSQIYPVQVVPTVVSPYSSKLSDYSNGMVNRLNLQLITTDILMQNQPVELHIKILGNGITAQTAPILSGIRSIYLNGGEILSLSSIELAGYFRFQNLQGITSTQYSKSLPDGVYTICYEVRDAITKKRLSQNSCATIYLMLNDPPLLNVPSQNEQIASGDFTNIIFSWTPRQINATNVSYEYELKEILDPNLDPRFAFEVSPLLYKEEGLRTTTLLYDISKPTLIPGKRYVWRVKAISTSGLGENSVFKNDGYSEIYTFSYTTNCSAPRYLLSEQQSNSRVKVMWQGESSFKKYHIQYRKSDVDNAEWFEAFSLNTQTILSNLEPGFTYEFRVGASCETTSYGVQQSYVYSNIQTFSLENKDKNNTASKYNCGIVPKIEITNKKLLPTMVINETFMAGDFPVKVLDVSGDNGVYSGNGYIQVPYLFDTRIKVDFSGITINEDYQLIDGVVETTYNPDWSNVEDIDEFIDGLFKEIKDLLKKIEKIEKENSEFANQLENGKISKEEYEDKIKINDSLLNDCYINIDKKIQDVAKSDFISEDEIEGLNSNNNSSKLVYNDISPSDVPDIIKNSEKTRSQIQSILEEVESRENKFFEELSIIQQAIEQVRYAYINCKVCEENNSNSGHEGNLKTSFESSVNSFKIGIPKNSKEFTIAQISCVIMGFNEDGYLQELRGEKGALNTDINEDIKKYLSSILEKEKQAIYVENEFKYFEWLYQLEKIDPCSDIVLNELEEVLAEEIRKTKIKSDLEFVTSQLRGNQAVEYYIDDNTIYRLNAGGFLEKLENPLSNDDLIEGNWQDITVDNKLRIGYTEGGKLELKSFGIRKNLPLSDKFNPNQEIDLSVVSINILESTNKFFRELDVSSVKQTGVEIKIDSDTFADGDNFGIDKNRYLFKIVSEGMGIVTTLLKTSEIEKEVYLSANKSDAVIHAPGLVTGSVEVAAQRVTDITSLVTLVYDFSTDDEKRQEVKEQFKEIKDQVGEDPKAFLPILKEVALTVLTNNTSEDWIKVTDSNADNGQRSHLMTRGTGNAIISTMSGVALYTKLPQINKNVTNSIKYVKKSFSNTTELKNIISKKRKDIRKVLDINEGKEYARKYFNKFVKENDFEKWYEDVFKKYYLGEPLNFEVHHIIPIKVLDKNKELQKLLLWAYKSGKKFEFNGIDNGIPLPKKSKKYDISGHSNHRHYDDAITEKINDIIRKAPNHEKAFERIQNLINITKQKLEKEVLLGNKDVNQIINFR